MNNSERNWNIIFILKCIGKLKENNNTVDVAQCDQLGTTSFDNNIRLVTINALGKYLMMTYSVIKEIITYFWGDDDFFKKKGRKRLLEEFGNFLFVYNSL